MARKPLNFAVHPSPASATADISPFPSRRSTVHSSRGLVSSAQPLASAAGIAILEKGGNAADAAVAVAAALNVTEPSSTGIGGDAFCLYWSAKDKTVRGINGSGRAPAGLTLQKLHEKGIKGDNIPLTSVHSVTVPGAASAWCDSIRMFGSGKLQLKDVLEPAIRLAENGYPVSELHARAWQRSESLIKNASPNSAEMMHSSGRPPLAGEFVTHKTLAATFRELAAKGAEGFYRGRIAEEIVKVCQDLGGYMTLEDLENHLKLGSEEVKPIEYTYGETSPGAKDGVTLHECPPNGSGIVALEALGLLDSLVAQGKIKDPLDMEHNSVEYLHALIEVLRLGFADGQTFVTDPDEHFGGLKYVDTILSRKYLDDRAGLFDASKKSKAIRGNPENRTDTVYFSVVDEEGNACSFINSNYAGFGSGIIPRGCGFTLQNRGSGFVLEEGHLNCVAPKKRPYHTIIPAMATRWNKERTEKEVWLCYGVMGGFMQPQGHVQVLLNLLRGMSPQQALDAPRFCIGAGTPDQGDILSTTFLEEGITEEVEAKLREMGHDVKILRGWAMRQQFGRGQINLRLDQGEGRKGWAAGSDPRADGQAVPQV